jgi:hypothetical protein
MSATETAFRPGSTVRVTARYDSVTIGTTARVHREPDHNGNLIVDFPARGRMQYPADSLEVIAPPTALPAERPSPVSDLVARHVERLKITESGRDRRPTREQVEAEEIRHADPRSIGNADVDAIKAPGSGETPEKASTAILAREPQSEESRPKRVTSDEQRAAIKAGKARAKAERAALVAIGDPVAMVEMTETARDTVSLHIRGALVELLKQRAPASDLVAVARMIERHEADR